MGQLRTRKRGSTWEWSFEGARIDGKRNPISKGGYRTKADALAAGTQAKAEYDNAGMLFQPSEISVSDFYDLWLEEYCKVNLKQGTYNGYKKKVDNHIKPALGNYHLKSLTPTVLQRFLNDKFNEGYSRNTMSALKGLLTGALNYAVEPLHFIKYNPALPTKLPSKRAAPVVPTRKKERKPITFEQWAAIITRFPERHPYHLPLQLAYRCGLRIGEVFALTWEDIDLEARTLRVDRQVQEYNNCWTFDTPKYDSFRIIELDSKITQLLARTKAQQEKARDFYAEYYTQLYEDGQRRINSKGIGLPIHLVCTRDNGTYIHPRVMQHCFRVIHYKLGYLDMDFHSLRHTHATLLLEAGANIKDVQKRLGHKHASETLDIYAHSTPQMATLTVGILESLP